jgi:hypothetical protein
MTDRRDRTYDERQVALILRRAGELQQQRDADGRAMTLSELEVVAREAGIDPALVRRAAAELVHVHPPPPRDSPWLGGPLALALDSVVDGNADASMFERLVALVRSGTGEHGTFDVIGGSFSWASTTGPQAGGMGRQIHVNVTIAKGSTALRIEEKLAPLAGALFGGLFGGLGGGGIGLVIAPLVALGAPAFVPVGLAAWLGAVWLLTRRLYRTRVDRRRRELESLRRALVAAVEDSVT